jgi:hypothetical protein
MNSKATEPTASASSRYYFLVWLALGAAGIFYVTVASLAPEALRAAGDTETQVAELSSTVSQLKSKVDANDSKQKSLASGLESIRGEMSGLKVKVADIASLDQAVATRLSALEGHPVPAPEAKADANGNGATPVTQEISNKASMAAAPAIDGVVVPDEPVADAAPATVKKPVKVAAADSKPKPYAVDLAVSTSTDALRQIWQLFQEQHAGVLAGLSPRAAQSGPNVRLLAGPFPSQAAAAAQCAKMRKEGITCQPAPLTGTPLYAPICKGSSMSV